MATNTLTGLNVTFDIKNADGTSFHDLVLHKSVVESIVMSLGDKISGDVYYKDNTLSVTMQEYVEYKGIHYVLVNPPTILREGMVSDNSELSGMTKYSFAFYHPMYMLGNFPFTDVAVNSEQQKYLSQDKTFSWIGTLFDMRDKLNANLASTEWYVEITIPHYELDGHTETQQWQKASELCEVMSFDRKFVSEVLKDSYDQWEIPFVIVPKTQTISGVTKKFAIQFGLPSQEIFCPDGITPFVFQMGKGVGLKNNSRTPRNNKIVTRLAGYGSERNIPYGYPQIVWTGNQSWNYTINNAEGMQPIEIGGQTIMAMSYPIYDGIVGGQKVKLIKHPFTRKTLMPSIYAETVNKKVNPLALGYDPDTVIIDYHDTPAGAPNPTNQLAPSFESHEFEEDYPQLGDAEVVRAFAYEDNTYLTYNEFHAYILTKLLDVNNQIGLDMLNECDEHVSNNPLSDSSHENVGGSYTASYSIEFHQYAAGTWYLVSFTSPDVKFTKNVYFGTSSPAENAVWDDTMNDDGEYVQSYFKMTLPQLQFDVYACASITEEMKINMRSGTCIGCTFGVYVDWDDYKSNFYHPDGTFDPVIHTTAGDGHVRDGSKYPDSSQGQITVIVKKDNETFGKLIPNVFQQPAAGDKFVILGISLPLSYITDAQTKLDGDIDQYILDNNIYYYDYPLKFDEFFFAQNPNILSQIDNNNIVRFKFAGFTNVLYIKQIVVRYGDKPLPQYDITLTDDVEIVLNQIGQVTDDVSRIRVQLNELQKYYGENIVNEMASKLSRINDDVCMGRITFQQGLTAVGDVFINSAIGSPDFRSGLYGGRGWRIDELGNAEFESARVRSFLEVVEMIVNRQRAQEGDTLFTDNDQIDKVEEKTYNGTTYYKLSLKEKWGGYVSTQETDNILKGVINTLAAKQGNVSDVTESQSVESDGANKFYTSWMKVIDPSSVGDTVETNQVTVMLYGDSSVPAGKNFKPCELMTIARWGCDADPDASGLTPAQKSSIIRRQNVFSISTSDGRFAKLRGVRSPKLGDTNYGTTLGIVPDFINQWAIASRLQDGRDYLYAQGVIVGDFIKVDALGNPLTNYVDCGDWQDNTPYLHNEYNPNTLQWETNDVWHNGSYWRCLITQPYQNVYYEPTDENNLYWEKLLTSGSSITKTGETYRYATNNTGVRPAADSSDWSTTKPTLQQGYWLYTETTIHWSDGSSTVLYTDERDPNDGIAGQDIVVDGSTVMKYAVSLDNTNIPSTWYNYSDIASQIVAGTWLWCKATTYYRKSGSAAGSHDAGSSVTYTVSYNGDDGSNGRAVSAVSEHYNVSDSSSTSWNVPSSGTWANEWTTDPNVPDGQGNTQWGQNNKYLWNYEKIVYTESDGTTTISRTTPSIVAVWTKDGKGIDTITNYYKTTNTTTTPARQHEGGTGWSTTPVAPTANSQFLWNYEMITWTEGTPKYTDVEMIGHYGRDGESPWFADLDNEMDSVACGNDKKPIVAQDVSTTLALYHGLSAETFTISVKRNGTPIALDTASYGVTVSFNSTTKVMKVSYATSAVIDGKDLFEITLTSGSVTRKLVLTVNGIKGDAKYSLAPSASVIKKNPNTNVYDPASLSCSYTKIDVAKGQEVTASGGTIKYTKDGGTTEYTYSSALTAGTDFTSDVTFLLYVGTLLVDKERIPVVSDGVNGTSPYFADLDNEMDSVACNYLGVTGSEQSVTTHISMFKGNAKQSIKSSGGIVCKIGDVTLGSSYTSGTVTVTDNYKVSVSGLGTTEATVQVFVKGGTTITRTQIDITVVSTIDGSDKSSTLVMTINGVKAGAAGESAVLYNLLPSESSVNVSRNAAGGYSPRYNTLKCGYTKTVGGVTTTTDEASGTIDYLCRVFFRRRTRSNSTWESTYYYYNNSTYKAYLVPTATFGTGLDAQTYDKVEFILYKDTSSSSLSTIDTTKVMDKETIPVVSDGAAGTSPWFADLNNEMDSVQCDHNGNVAYAQTVTTTASVFRGSSAEAFFADSISRNGTVIDFDTATNGVTPTFDINTKVLSIAYGTTASITDRDEFELVLKDNGRSVTLSVVFTVNGVRGVAMYKLVPSDSQVVKKKDETYTPSGNITCSVAKVENGVESTPSASEYVLKKILNGGSEVDYSATAASSITSDLKFLLYDGTGSYLLDKETIPLVTDGDDGADAAVATVSPSGINIQCNSNGNVVTAITNKSLSFGLKVGTHTVTVSSVSVNGSLPTGVTVTGVAASGKLLSISTSATASGLVNGISFTVNGTYNGVIRSAVVTLILPCSLQGIQGIQGKMSRNIYFGGKLSAVSGTTFNATDYSAPYVDVETGTASAPNCYVYVGANGTGIAYPTTAAAYASSSDWEIMTTDFKYLITNGIFAAFAKLGSAIFNGDYMFSQYGYMMGFGNQKTFVNSGNYYQDVDVTDMFGEDEDGLYSSPYSVVNISTDVNVTSSSYTQIGSGFTLVAGKYYTLRIEENSGLGGNEMKYKIAKTASGTGIVSGSIFASSDGMVSGNHTFICTSGGTYYIYALTEDSGNMISNRFVSYCKFVPNLCFNMKTGKMAANDIIARGALYANSLYYEYINNADSGREIVITGESIVTLGYYAENCKVILPSPTTCKGRVIEIFAGLKQDYNGQTTFKLGYDAATSSTYFKCPMMRSGDYRRADYQNWTETYVKLFSDGTYWVVLKAEKTEIASMGNYNIQLASKDYFN